MKRCVNCGRYPFCNKSTGAGGYCESWIKRRLECQIKEPKKN